MLIDLILERRKKEYLNFIAMKGKDLLQVRLLFSLILFIGAAFVAYFLFELDTTKTATMAIIGGVIGFKLPYIQLILQKKSVEEKNANMFADFSQAVVVLLPTKKNVLTTIRTANEYTGSPLKEKIDDLIEKIETYGDRREFYLELADYIKTPDAFTTLDQLYKFSIHGYSDEILEKQQRLIREIQTNKMDFIIEKKKNGMVTFGILPILTALILMFGIIGVILSDQFKNVTQLLF